MREEIIIQGNVIGYIEKDNQRAFLTEEAPSSILDELLETGYAVCVERQNRHRCVGSLISGPVGA